MTSWCDLHETNDRPAEGAKLDPTHRPAADVHGPSSKRGKALMLAFDATARVPGVDTVANDSGAVPRDDRPSHVYPRQLLAAQRGVIRLMGRAVSRACRSFCYRGPTDQDDLRGRALERVVRGHYRTLFETDPDALRPLVWSIAKRVVIDALRYERALRRSAAATLRTRAELLPDPRAADPLSRLTLREVLGELERGRGGEVRVAVVVLTAQGASQHEIGRQLSIPKATVGYWLNAERRAIQRRYA
ncbi:MAG: hypothetical protein OXU20_17000 [Myxococcales bacterium]|nr:hypothetical protein [Myxococcales bacterium]MDD9968578.1 hypothetical protein [Myxococcales bacterium]